MRGVLFYSMFCTGYFLLRFSKWQAFFSHCISITGISFFCLWPVQKESLQVMGPKIMAGLYSHDFWKELSSFQKQMSISCWCWECECCCFNITLNQHPRYRCWEWGDLNVRCMWCVNLRYRVLGTRVIHVRWANSSDSGVIPYKKLHYKYSLQR